MSINTDSAETSVFAEAHRLESRGEAFALAFIIASRGSTPRESGRMLIRRDGTSLGTVGGGAMEAMVMEEAEEALSEGVSRTVERNLVPEGKGAAGMECGGAMAVRIDISTAPPRLLLIGGGHVNLAVARTAAQLGFVIEVAESREEFCTRDRFPMARNLYRQDNLITAIADAKINSETYAVIATHDDDIRALGALAESTAAYIGMLGSKRKVAVAVSTLRERGIAEEVIAGIRAPVGLDIGAETPEEIAISVMAEILKVRSGRNGLPLQGMSKDLVVIRGGGDLATGVAWRLKRSGFKVIILEIPQPTVIRRTVAFASALINGELTVEGIRAVKAEDVTEAYDILENGDIPVLADPDCHSLNALKPAVLVDAILAKRNLGTARNMAPTVITLGPGFNAGKEGDCHAVIETARGHELGRVILDGPPQKDSGIPGTIAGKTSERVLRAPSAGIFEALVELGDLVTKGQLLARITHEGKPDSQAPGIKAPFDGKVRGLLTSGLKVSKGFKVGDVDPRGADVDEHLISDKARAIAGGVLEAILLLRNRAAGK